MFASLERYIPLFQAYLNAKDPQSFLQSLNDPTQKKILQILTEDVSNVRDYEKKMQEFSLNPTLASELVSLKLTNYLQNAKELKDDEIWNQIKIRFGPNNFEFPRPQTLSANDPTGQKQDLTPSHLHVKQTLQSYLDEKLTLRPDFIRNLNDYAISRVNNKVLLSLPLSEKEYLLDKCGIIYHFQKSFISQFLSQYENQKRKQSPSYRLSSKVLINLTKDQINYLGETNTKFFDNEDYIQLWFNLNYSERIMKHIEDSQYFSKVQHLNKRNEFIQIVADLSKINHSIIKAYINKFKGEIMLLDLIVGDPMIERLIQYLHNNSSTLKLRELNKNQAKKLRENQAAKFVPKMRYVLQIDKQQPDQLVEDYLEKLFRYNNKDKTYIERLSVFFNSSYLQKLNAKATLFLGQHYQGIDHCFSSDQLRSIKEQKSIKLHATNKRKYRPNDDVQLEVSIKNIDRIDIKIYELSLEKHYLTQAGQIQDDINLSFLRPAVQQVYTNQDAKENPFKVVDTVIKIREEHIPKRMGVFIVDLQGDTVSSRAIIRKGAILCLQSFTEAGQQFGFYDQGGKPLTHNDGLKIWVKGKPKALKENTNYFFMNYVEKAQWLTIIASVGNYAEMYQKELKAEQYKFQVGYLYNPESFIVGKKAKVVLHGRLSMNNCPMSLQLLHKIKVKVTVTNNLKISTYYSFNIDKWVDREDPFIQFPIQSYTSAINISIEANILLQSQKQTTVTHYKQITIDLQENQQNFIDIYLQKGREEDYILSVLGQNGQTIGHTDVILSYSINGVDELQKTKVKTDDKGTVKLGKLSIVRQLAAELTVYKTTVSRLWQLDTAEAGLSYPNVIHVKVGQEISLPVDHKWTKQDFVLLRTFDKYFIEDISSDLKLHNGKITLPTINKQGYYILKILPIEKVIEVLTLKNYKWEGDTDENQKVYDQFHGKIYDINKNLYQNINIQAIKQEKLEDKTKIHVKLNLSGLKEEKHKYVRVHAFATNYVAPEFHQAFTPQAFNLQPQLNQHYFYQKNSAYFSNKTLSDEGAYVWKRQRQNERIIGNNLQKPGIFLKRTLVRQTKQEDEDLDFQDRYIQECAMMKVDPNLRQRAIAKKKEKSDTKIGRVNYLNSHNNFLALSGQVLNNLNGQTITFQIPNNYNNVQLFILTPRTAVKKTISLGHTQTKKYKDLRHVGMIDSQNSKGWTMSREVYELNVGKEMVISRNSLWRTATLPDIYQFANAKRCNLYDWSSHLLSWSKYSQAKKKQIYDKQCCHELNAFLYFQDRQFFDKIVKPFISNKINKTFVDLCLIGDKNIKQFAKIDRLSKLNAFEKVLLIHSLVEQKQKETAANITKMLKLQQDSIKKNYQLFKINFDTMINSKVGEQKKGKISQQRQRLEEMRCRRSRRSASRQRQIISNQLACYQYKQMVERAYRRAEKKEAFVPIESTKQYTQRTYYNIKNYKAEAPNLVDSSSFWAKLAEHLLSGKTTDFLSKQFMSLKTNVDFILAACFISAQSSANFDLQTCGQNYKITAKSPMLLYVKQVKEVEFAQKFGVQINQRFIDPQNMHTYEDGLQIERQVEEFIVKKPYIAQTVVTNTSGTPLQLQILLDIPQGAIPLHSHQYTEIVNIVLRQYTSQVYKRVFYLPSEGEYSIYPSNACKGSTIIAKAPPKPKIIVKKYLTINKLQSFDDILRSGDKQKIIQFIKTDNIFDENKFDPASILWMLKDKEFYFQVTQILRERRYYNQSIWSFAFYHRDLPAINEAISYDVAGQGLFEPTVFQYFPYYSSRTHQFANQTKSTIRNVQFKESYIQFLVSSVVGIDDLAIYSVSLAYYLILQDRLKEADIILKRVAVQFPDKHKIQVDYMRCFLDMSLNAPNFEVAREIMDNYKDYPIESWKKLFDEVRKSLQAQDNDFDEEIDNKRLQQYQTQVIQQIGQFKIIQPADTSILVEFFQLNLQVFFSEYPFYDYKAFTAVKPSQCISYPASSQTKEIIVKRKDFPHIRDVTVEITEAKQGLPPKKVSTFQWSNAELKVKISENAGTLQVFINKKKFPGAYVKVFSKKSYAQSFYRDGYTDMTGTFRYAMSDLEGITQFSILVLTDKGGIIQKIKPPSKVATY